MNHVSQTMLGITAGALLAGSANAVVLLDEQFNVGGSDYTADTAIVNQTAGGGAIPTGYGWATGSFWSSNNSQSGTSTNNLVVNAAGQAEVPISASNGGQAFRTLDTPLADTVGNTYYVSYDAQSYNNNTRYFGLAFISGATERCLIGHGTGQTEWGINNMTDGSYTGTFSSGVLTTVQAHIVAKIVFGGAGTPEQVSVWVNPDLGLSETNAANDAVLINGGALTSAVDWGDITQLRIGSGNNSGSNLAVPHWFDNLMIDTDSPFTALQPGDANGDGMVNLADLQILGDNWQSTTASWSEADFTGDGNVNLADLQILGDNWGFGVGSDLAFDEALAQVAIPEPAGLALLGMSGVLLLRRRR